MTRSLKKGPYINYDLLEKVEKLSKNNQKIVVHLAKQYTGHDLNKYLVGKGIIVSHLATERKNLEEQFLEILSQSK